MKKTIVFACLLAVSLSLSRADDTPVPNLLSNPGFEKWMDWTPPNDPAAPRAKVTGGRRPQYWDYEVEAYERSTDASFPVTVTIFRDEDIKHGGDYSVKIQNAAKTDIGGLTMGAPMTVTPNTTYKLKFWYKGEDIVPNAGDGAGVVFWTGEAPTNEIWKNSTITAHAADVKTGTFDWKSYEFTFTTKATTNNLSVTAQLRRAQGSVWFDDFEMTQANSAMPAPAAPGMLK